MGGLEQASHVNSIFLFVVEVKSTLESNINKLLEKLNAKRQG
jgi:hypothetical protein